MMIDRKYMLVDVVWVGLRTKRWKTEDGLKRRRELTITFIYANWNPVAPTKCGKYPQAREGDPRELVVRFAIMSSLTIASISQTMIAHEIGVPVLW